MSQQDVITKVLYWSVLVITTKHVFYALCLVVDELVEYCFVFFPKHGEVDTCYLRKTPFQINFLFHPPPSLPACLLCFQFLWFNKTAYFHETNGTEIWLHIHVVRSFSFSISYCNNTGAPVAVPSHQTCHQIPLHDARLQMTDSVCSRAGFAAYSLWGI